MSLPKPYYEEPGITIYNADCKDILPDLEPVDLVLTDPPYGICFDTDYTRFSKNGSPSGGNKHDPIKNDDKPFDPSPWLKYSNVILWGMNCFSNKLPLGSILIWDKRFKSGGSFLSDAEVAWMNKGHGAYIYSETAQGAVRNEPVVHPTQKPEGLMRWCMEKFPNVCTILDPFMGSGTTLRAAKDLRHKAIGIEIDKKYCDIAIKRLQQEVFDFGEIK